MIHTQKTYETIIIGLFLHDLLRLFSTKDERRELCTIYAQIQRSTSPQLFQPENNQTNIGLFEN
jgi:hypothetical protein